MWVATATTSFSNRSSAAAFQRRNSEPRVDQGVAVPAANVPDVAAHQRVHVGFPEQRDLVIDALAVEPAIGDRQSHLRFLVV